MDDPYHAVRTVHMITREVQGGQSLFQLSIKTGIISRNNGKGWAGFLVGTGAGVLDYRASALVHCSSGKGGGLLAVLNTENGNLEFRNMGVDSAGDDYPLLAQSSGEPIGLDEEGLCLKLEVVPDDNNQYDLTLSAVSTKSEKELKRLVLLSREEKEVLGSVALAANPVGEEGERGTTFWFSEFQAGGEKLNHFPERAFGPLAACLYTTANGILKLTAQFMPLGPDLVKYENRRRRIVTHQATLEYRPADRSEKS